MRSHPSTILSRAIKTALRSPCRYKEERLIAKSPKSLSKIILGRVGMRGELLPIHPCKTCEKLLDKYGVKVLNLEDYI